MKETLALAFLGHMVGDYLLQNDWMALNKKQSLIICTIHGSIWALCVCLLAGFSYQQYLVLAVVHILQDHTNLVTWYMKLVGQEKFMTGPCSPWSIIIVDNVFHLLQIYLVWRFL